jgi:hypothetical protein
MSRFQRKILAGLVLSGVGIVASAGCADNDSSLFIAGVLAPQPPDCSVTADPTSTMEGGGTLDVLFSYEFRAWLLVGNQLTARGRKQQVRTETARINLRGAEITLTDSGGGEMGSFTVPGTGFVTISRSEDPGYGAFLATLIPPNFGSSLGSALVGAPGGSYQTVVANVRVFGDTLGGEEIESAELSYPIRVCYGCTVSYPAEALSGDQCNVGTSDEKPCFAGQGAIDCRACSQYDVCNTVP